MSNINAWLHYEYSMKIAYTNLALVHTFNSCLTLVCASKQSLPTTCLSLVYTFNTSLTVVHAFNASLRHMSNNTSCRQACNYPCKPSILVCDIVLQCKPENRTFDACLQYISSIQCMSSITACVAPLNEGSILTMPLLKLWILWVCEWACESQACELEDRPM